MGLPGQPFAPERMKREAAEAAEREAKRFEREHGFTVRSAMQHRESRALLRWFFLVGRPAGSDPCPIYSTFDSNAMHMAGKEQARNLRVLLWEELERHAPDELRLLRTESEKEP